MNPALFVALTLAAPALKDPPKKELNIVGEWVVESQTTGGRVLKTTAEVTYMFGADGGWTITRKAGKAVGVGSRTYTVDPKADPPAIDMKLSAAAARPTYQGIVKVDGDRLTLCYTRSGEDRPTRFESPEGSNVILIILRRMPKE